MKKIFAFAAIVAGVIASQACSRESLGSKYADGEVIPTTISVQAAPGTRAAIDNDGMGANATRCQLQIWMQDGTDYKLYETKTSEDNASPFSVSVDLIAGQVYKLVAWVDGGADYYTLDDEGNVTRVDETVNNTDSLDAFYGVYDNLEPGTSGTVTINATRPFAQLNFITKDLKEDFVPSEVTISYKAPVSMNLLTGELGEAKDLEMTAAPYCGSTIDPADGQWTLAMDYIFAEASEQTIIDVTLAATIVGEAQREFNSLPVQRNYRTNVIGKLLTVGQDIQVIVVPGWETPDVNDEIWDGSIAAVPAPDANDGFIHITSASELAGLAAAVNKGESTFEGKTVVLDADINLGNTPWTPVGGAVSYPSVTFAGTFDGQDHVISNLNASDSTPNYACAGLFGSTLGTVKNLTVKNVTLTSNHYAGAIVAYSSSSNSVVENCHVDGGTITSSPEWLGSEYDNGDKVGGIFGYSGEGAPITGCSVKNVTIRGYRDLGGIVGFARGTLSNNTVENVTIIQDNTNGYKSSVTTFGEIIGNDDKGKATLVGNTATNVTIKSITSVSTQEELAAAVSAAAAGAEIFVAPGTYTVPNIPNNITISGSAGTVFNCAGTGSIASIPNGATFENVEFNFGQTNYHGFQHAGTVNMNGCTLNGLLFSYGDMNFTDCHFIQTAEEYNMWAYGMDLTFTDCVFDSCGKFLNVYNEGSGFYTVSCEGCQFNSSVVKKAALNIKATSGTNPLHHEVTINNCSANFELPASTSETLVVGSAIWQVDDINAGVDSSNKVTVDGVVVYNGK